jgi:hypothetical protein
LAEYDSVIPAGGSGKLVANMRTPPLLDRRVSKTVAVHTDAEGGLNLNLRFSVDVQTPILFKPSNRLVITTLEGEEARKRVLLQRADGEALVIRGADTGDPSLEAIAEPVMKNEKRDNVDATPGEVWLELVLAADAPVGSRTGKLRLATNHPVASSFEVAYAMRVRPLIESRPAGARLWTSPSTSGDGYSSFLTLNRNGKGDFTITGIEASHPEIFTATAISTEPGQRQMVRVELAEDVHSDSINGTIEGWIEIRTDVSNHPILDVPVLVGSSREATRRGFPTRGRE